MKPQALATLRNDFASVRTALRTHATEIAAMAGLAAARPGYSTDGDAKRPALVLAFHPGKPRPDVTALGARFGVEVRAVQASPDEQLRGALRPSFASPLAALLDPVTAPGFAPPARGSYEPPEGPDAPTLDAVDDEMEVTVCASPDAGWPVLRDFLAEGVEERLTVAIYDFTARHIEKALVEALGDDATLRLVFDGKTASGGVGGTGINGPDSREADVMKRLRTKLGDRFEPVRASVGAGGAVPKAYHIKVAVADGARMWLSSGNWQSSNLPPFDFAVAGDAPPLPVSRYNRDYHVVVRHEGLAETYAAFIEHDASLGDAFGGPEVVDEPMLLVPEDEAEDFAPARRFKPFTVSGRVRVTPLLTPDNFPGFVNKLLARAKERVWIQNQYIEPKEEGDNFPELDRLVELLGELAEKVDLRISLRTPKEEHRDRLLAAGVLPSQLRRQSNCHAKLIIVDDKHLVVGSQNLSNLGFVANRDASLAFENEEINAYYAEIFESDWDRGKPMADGDSFAVAVAAGDEAPAGMTRMPWSALFDTPPPSASATSAAPIVAPGPPAAPLAVLDIPFFGVDEEGKRAVENVEALATKVRQQGGAVDPEQRALGVMAGTPSLGLPIGAHAEDLSEVGWGVVWAPGTSADVKQALAPLLEHRRAEVGDESFFHEIDYQAGESLQAFLGRLGGERGSIKPGAVPYHLLLVGTPEQIPFPFQTLLDVEYRVGRLDLPHADAYRLYADSLVAVETGTAKARDRVLHAFGPVHDGDAPTALSVEVLVRAAESWPTKFTQLTKKHKLAAAVDAGEGATKARLLEILRGGATRPEVLFTAGHGMAIAAGKPRQAGEQGALVTADWDGFGAIGADARFAADDLPADADLTGLTAFVFACFGAGTPATDSFPTRAGQKLADKPFVSALPRALLSHPKGAALGVFGHVDRTLTWSLQPPGAGVATDPFARAAFHVLAGNRLGAALDDLNQRSATLAAEVADALRPGAPPLDDRALLSLWTQQRDATAFLLLGDPAARLPR
jgi:hypothetical protein